MEGRLPPHSIEAERAVLGAALIDPDVVGALKLSPDEFYREPHRMIWAAILEVARRREPPDIVTVAAELERRGEIEQVGGRGMLADLSNSTPTSLHADAYAKIVVQKAISRRLIRSAGEIAAIGYADLADPDAARDQAEAILFSARRSERALARAGGGLEDTLNSLIMLNQQRLLPGVDTGFDTVNDMTGGLQPSDLVILAARPSVGKTSFALNIAEHVAINRNKTVGFFSLEMSQSQLMMRLVSSLTGINGHELRQMGLSERDLETYAEEFDALAHAPLFIDDQPNVSVMEVRAKARRLQAEANLSLVIVDYLQLMRSGKSENRVQEVSDISAGLKGLARELEVPVLALSQLSRGVESRGEMEPRLSDLRESGSIEQDADVVMFLWRDKQDTTPDLVNFKIAKHRNGPIGEAIMRFDRHHTRFTDA